MEEKKEDEKVQDVEVVPLNVIIGELEIIQQKLYGHVMTLSTTKDPETKE